MRRRKPNVPRPLLPSVRAFDKARERRSRTGNPGLIFELVEPRVLLSADLLGLAGLPGTDLGNDQAPWDIDGVDAGNLLADLAATSSPDPGPQVQLPLESALQSISDLTDSDGSTDKAADVEPWQLLAGNFGSAGSAETSSELLIIDTRVPDYQGLMQEILAGRDKDTLQIFVLDPQRDGIEQISRVLNGRHDIDAIHILSHGSEDGVQLGATWLSNANLVQYTEALKGWGEALSDDADLLLYGCDIAADSDGQALVDAIAEQTGADVAASTDVTGNEAWDGDWRLEYRAGSVETASFDAVALQGWQGTLATFTVDTTADTVDATPGDSNALDGSSNTSLRAAIMEANALGGSHTIVLSADTYTLSIGGKGTVYAATGDLDISADITLIGAGVDQTTVDAAGVDRIFDVQLGGSLTLSGLTLQGGEVVTGVIENGGAVRVAGGASLTASEALFRDNSAREGGAIANTGTLNLTDVTVDQNDTTQQGGGISTGSPSAVATLEGVTVSNNVNIGNQGGGIYVGNGDFTGVNLTVTGNKTGPLEDGDGGGVFAVRPITLTNSTITDNTAGFGSGLYTQGDGSMNLVNTIVAGNHNSPDVYGAFISGGNNLIGDVGVATGLTDGVNDDQVGSSGSPIDPLLGALADNGGPTRTHALLDGSPAIDAGQDAGISEDQRGVARPLDGDLDGSASVDIGAFERLTLDSAYLSSKGDVATSGTAGIDTWDKDAALEVGDPGFTLEPGITAGTFAELFDLVTDFTADAATELTGLHVVSQDITVGGTVTLLQGDVLFSVNGAQPTLSSSNTLANMGKTAVVRFRPDTAGDYSAGTFETVLDDPLAGAEIGGISLVEQDTRVGDRWLAAGDFLVVETKGVDTLVHHFAVTGAGAGATSGSSAVLIDGADIGIGTADFTSVHLVSSTVSAGGTVVDAGTVLVSLDKSVAGFAGLAGVTPYDMVALDVSATGGGTTAATGSLIFEGVDIKLETASEEIEAFSLANIKPATGSVAPTAISGGAYTINEGDDLVLDASGSSDPDGTIVEYRWDLNNDLTYGDVTTVSATPTIDWATLVSWGLNDGDVGGKDYTIGLQVVDDQGATDETTATVTIDNLAPTLSVTGTGAVAEGVSYTLNLSASDPGNDTITGWTINWGDGSIDTIVGNPTSTPHTYSVGGFTYNVLASATDEDGSYLSGDLLVTSNGTSSLFRFDAASASFEDEFADANGLSGTVDVEIGPDGLVYATGFGSEDLHRYDAATGAFVDKFSAGSQLSRMAFGPDGNLYVTSHSTDEVLRFDLGTETFGTFITAGSGTLDQPDGIVFGPDGNLYVASDANGKILRYDGVTGAFMNTFATTGTTGFSDIQFGPDGNLYFSNVGANKIVEFDGGTGTNLGDFVTAGSGGINGAAGFRFAPDGDLYVVGFNDDQLYRYSGTDGSPKGVVIDAGSGMDQPINLVFTPVHRVTVNANEAPTLTSFAAAVTSGDEDSVITGTFADLVLQGDEGDTDGSVEAFVVKAVTSGTLKIGTDAASATDWVADSNDTVNAANNAYWTPDSNSTGDIDAFAVVAMDDDGAESGAGVPVVITVNPVNDVPVLGNNALTLNEGDTVVLSASELSATDADTDDATLTFSVSSVSGGQFELLASPGSPITSFTQDQVTAGEVQFVHDGGETEPGYLVSISDGSDTTAPAPANVSFTNVNDAPALADDSPTLTTINEDDTGSVGDSVAAVVVDGSISDADGAAVESIAITAVDEANGTWQYSTDNGGTWTNVDDGSLGADHALLLDGTLAGASTQRLRFVPDADYDGSASFSFRAWDQSTGAAGTYADTTSNGGATAFSAATDSASIAVNDAPTAAADGAYSINEGDDLILDASGSSDPDGTIVEYRWDLNNDLTYGDVTTVSATPTIDWATLVSWGLNDGSVGGTTYTIGLQVVDDQGATDETTATVTIDNVAPTLSVTGTGAVAEGVSYTLNLSASDPGNDTITGWTINWGDGSIDTIVGNPTSTTHTYTASGFTYNVLASATDEDGTHLQNQLLVASSGNDQVLRYDPDGGSPLVFDPPTGPAVIDYPVDTVIGPDGNLYVSGWNSDNVLRYDPATGGYIDEFVPVGSGGLNSAAGLAFGPDGNLYVASRQTSEVLRYDGSTGVFIDAFVTAGSGGLNQAEGLTFGPDGDLYVSDFANSAVYKYDGTTGAFDTVFVSNGSGGLNAGEDLTFGPDGNLYVASDEWSAVLRYDGTTGAFIDAFVPSGSNGLLNTTGIAFGPDGHLYVGSWGTDSVMRFDGATGAFIDNYVDSGSGGLSQTDYLTFVPEHQVTVTANIAPTLTALSGVVETTNEDAETEISFADLAAQGDEADTDGSVDAFVVRSVVSGSLKIGATAGSATAWAAGSNDVIDAANNAYWTPDSNVNGDLNAFEVVALDNDGAESKTNVMVQVTVNPVNDDPSGGGVLTSTSLNDNDGPSSLFGGLNVSDVDSGESDLVLRITLSDDTAGSISGGGFSHIGGGVYTATGLTVAQANTALDNVQFTPTNNSGSSGNFSTDIRVDVDDQGGGGYQSVLAPTTVTITRINDAPSLTGTSLTLDEDQTVTVTNAMLSATDSDDSNPGLRITVSSVSGGHFAYATNPAATITSFTQSEVGAGDVVFVDDGDENAPSFDVSVSDGVLIDGPVAATVNFTSTNDVPGFSSTAVTTATEGVAYSYAITASDADGDALTITAPTLPVWLTLIDHGDGTATLSGTPGNGDVGSHGVVLRVDDGTVTIDQSFDIGVDPINDVPVLGNNGLTLDEGQVVTLDSTMLSASDVDDPDPNLIFSVSSVDGGHFALKTAQAVPITSFTQAQVSAGDIVFVDDGDETAPGFDVLVSDGVLVDGPAAANIAFHNVNDLPVLGNHQLTLKQGETVTLSLANLSASDIDNADGDLIFRVANVEGGYFALKSAPAVKIVEFTQDQVAAGEVLFVDDGDGKAPKFKVEVKDGTGQTGKVQAKIDFTPTPVIKPLGPKPEPESGPELEPEPEEETDEGEEEASEPEAVVTPPEITATEPEPVTDALAEGTEDNRSAADRSDYRPEFKLKQVAQAIGTALRTDWFNPGEYLIETLHNSEQFQAFEQLLASGEFHDNLDRLRDRLDELALMDQTVLGTSVAASTGLSVGYVAWLVRGGVLLSTVLSSMPAWNLVDPLPVLASTRVARGAEDDDSLEDIIRKRQQEADSKELA